jgi:hypothetical protein
MNFPKLSIFPNFITMAKVEKLLVFLYNSEKLSVNIRHTQYCDKLLYSATDFYWPANVIS